MSSSLSSSSTGHITSSCVDGSMDPNFFTNAPFVQTGAFIPQRFPRFPPIALTPTILSPGNIPDNVFNDFCDLVSKKLYRVDDGSFVANNTDFLAGLWSLCEGDDKNLRYLQVGDVSFTSILKARRIVDIVTRAYQKKEEDGQYEITLIDAEEPASFPRHGKPVSDTLPDNIDEIIDALDNAHTNTPRTSDVVFDTATFQTLPEQEVIDNIAKHFNDNELPPNLNAISRDEGRAYLHTAVRLQKFELIKFLVEKGANINFWVDGYTPLDSLISACSPSICGRCNHDQIATFLVKNGAKTSCMTRQHVMNPKLVPIIFTPYGESLIKVMSGDGILPSTQKLLEKKAAEKNATATAMNQQLSSPPAATQPQPPTEKPKLTDEALKAIQEIKKRAQRKQ